jgi:thioredoxin-related protein
LIERVRSRVAALVLAIPFAAISTPLAAAPPALEGWLDDVATARARAEREGKPILVDLWADWCVWCKRLEQDVFSTPEFRDYARRFVLLRVDTEDGADGARLMEDFEVESLPTTMLVTPDLVEIGELRGYLPTERFLQSLELETAMHATLLRAFEDHRAGRAGTEVAAETVQTLADELHARRDGPRAAALYRELVERGDESPEVSAWNRYYLADSLRLGRSWEAAREAASAARAAALAAEDAVLVERIDLLAYLVARDAASCAEARQALDRFVVEHPDGAYSDVARAARERIASSGRCV